ncbi:hypothetical protein [Domibacillus mangrovi]|uniref:Uncharacterized protein n=1 Tax=Domibacillus mangrovi TaxID=1714354 RepID=A0A1Q5P358_9BACI|nr:hypothetical protein [Domibacillus mangrovi]OKL36689.1 hypothetical protein BLL40_08095 [Domibacillus mangrovi]
MSNNNGEVTSTLNPESEDEVDLVVESCDAILDTAKTVYNEESERFKQAEAKTNIALAFAGVLFAAYLTYLGTFKPIIKEPSYLVYTSLFKVAIFVLLVIGIIYFLRSIKTGEYRQVDLNNIVSIDFGKRSEKNSKLSLAFTYDEAVTLNKEGIEGKLRFYQIGLQLITYGFLIFAIHFLIEEVIRYVQ